MTPGEMCQYIKESWIMCIQREKQEVFRMACAMASLFKEGLLDKYLRALDKELDVGTSDLGDDLGDSPPPIDTESIKQLNKLSALFGKGAL